VEVIDEGELQGRQPRVTLARPGIVTFQAARQAKPRSSPSETSVMWMTGLLFAVLLLPNPPPAQVSAWSGHPATQRFRTALENAILATIEEVEQTLRPAGLDSDLRWKEPHAEDVAVPGSTDVLFVVQVPTLFPRSARPNDALQQIDYPQQVINRFTSTILDRSPSLAIPEGGRLVIMAVETPRSSPKQPAHKVFLIAHARDVDSFRRGVLSRQEFQDRITISREERAHPATAVLNEPSDR
jgi:hypothetical protein